MAASGPSVTIQRKKGVYPPPIPDLSRIRVGFPRSKSSQANIAKAIYNEFGTRRIPARPFLRTSLRNNRSKYISMARRGSAEVLAGKLPLNTLLARIAVAAVGDIQMSIVTGGWVANAPSTIKKKGSSRPLIDTGAMRQAVTWILD